MYPSVAAFAITLGPTNPWLITIAKETLVFRRPVFSTGLRLLVPTFLLLDAPFRTHVETSQRSRTLSYHSSCRKRQDKSSPSVLRLAPIIFGATSLNE